MSDYDSKIYKDVPLPSRRERSDGSKRHAEGGISAGSLTSEDVIGAGAGGAGSPKAGQRSGFGAGKSPWNYITEEDLFRDFSDTLRLRKEKEQGKYEAFKERVRRGELPQEPYAVRVGYARRWVNELLGINRTETAEEGWKILERFGEQLPDGLSLSGYLPDTLAEIRKYYVIMSDLPRKYVAKVFADEIRKDEQIMALIYYDEADENQVFEAVASFGRYKAEKSHFFEEHSLEMKQAVYRVYGAFAAAYLSKSGRKLTDDLFGERDERTWYPNVSIHFSLFPELKNKVFTYQVDPVLTYTCRRGSWTVSQYFPGIYGSKVLRDQLGQICRETERLLREADGYRSLKKAEMNEDLRRLTGDVVGKFVLEKEAEALEAARPRISIDLSRLHSIRSDADYTRDQLLQGTGEDLANLMSFGDMEESNDSAVISDAAGGEDHSDSGSRMQKTDPEGGADETVEASMQTPLSVPENQYGLTGDERQVLDLLLTGADPSDYIQSHHLFASIIADSINEKLFDAIGDSVVEETDGGLALIEDYAEDLEEALSRQPL